MAKVKWNQQAVEGIFDEIEQRLDVAAEHLRGAIVRNISTPTSVAGPSKPGEMPHADTGRLRQSIAVSEVPGDPLVRRIGTDVLHGVIHETGDRPFIRPTVIQERNTILRILGGGGSIEMNT